PWGEVARNQNKYISPKYLPLNFKVTDPSKMHKKDAIILLDFWRSHQDEDKHSVLRFRRWRGTNRMLQEPVNVKSAEDGPQVQTKKVRARQQGALQERTYPSMGQGMADESEVASDKPFEWSESDAPGDSRRSSVKGNKGKAKAMMRVVSPGVDELPTTAETQGRVTGGQATAPADQSKRRSQPGHLPCLLDPHLLAKVSKSTAWPKPTLKGKTLNAGNAEGSKKRRAPSTDSEEEDNVDGVRPMKKVRQGFAKQRQKAATPFPDAIKENANDIPEVEDTRCSTRKQKTLLPADFAVSPKMKGQTHHRQK
ncbi:hypothetical protein PAXRUDRAFT_180517, partial [Paxillus rubicundulus Ve08.2h10]